MAWKLNVNGKTYTMENEADYEYLSHINGIQNLAPDNYVANRGKDENGNDITAWYFVENPDETEIDSIDYDEPFYIVDEYGHVIYDLEEGDSN